jgi:colicin import membrane protein
VEEKPDPRAAEIALKAKQEAERRKRDEAEKEQQRKEAEKRAEEKRAEEKRAEEKRAEEKRAAEQKARVDAMRAQAEREVQQRARAEREAELKAQAEREQQTRAAAEQQRLREAAERAKADRARGEWIDRIRAKIKSNLVLPADLPGNPEAVFEVVQIPSGDIIDVHLRKSSGVRAYDDAVQRAILKSSPLPGPTRPDDFQRVLTLRFRPLD